MHDSQPSLVAKFGQSQWWEKRRKREREGGREGYIEYEFQ